MYKQKRYYQERKNQLFFRMGHMVRKFRRRIPGIRFPKLIRGICAAVILLLAGASLTDLTEEGEPLSVCGQFACSAEEKLYHTMLPLFSFVQEKQEGTVKGCFYEQLLEQFPLAAYARKSGFPIDRESMAEYERLLLLEGTDEEYTGELLTMGEEEEQALLLENEQAARRKKGKSADGSDDLQAGEGNEGVSQNIGTEKQFLYPLEEYQDYEKLIREFYTIDPTTMADETLLNLDVLLNRDMAIEREGDGPQILIYHTHSQEGFADSIPGEESMTVVGVGDHLTELLEERYGFRVLHHKGQYDVEKRDYAYTRAAPALEELLAENPSIQVVIDLHRDEVPADTKLVTDLNGKPTARFMFFNGLSRTKTTGEIPYLKNPYIEDNLAFAFQMQLACNEYYPGLTRKIYLKGYRYNMHYCPRTLLVELGAQTNTVEEAYNACEPLAAMLAHVLNGED